MRRAKPPPDVAVDVIRERLERQTGTPEERCAKPSRSPTTKSCGSRAPGPNGPAWPASSPSRSIEDDIVTVGHVGDSRLYLLRPGEIQQDHPRSFARRRARRSRRDQRRRSHAPRAPQRDLSRRRLLREESRRCRVHRDRNLSHAVRRLAAAVFRWPDGSRQQRRNPRRRRTVCAGFRCRHSRPDRRRQ